MARNVKIRILRGVKANIPALNLAELYLATDEVQLYVGNTGNALIGHPLYNTSGALQTGQRWVTGGVSLASGGTATVTLSGAAAFTSASTYRVFVMTSAAKRTLAVVKNSGTSFTISGGGTGDAVDFLCVGN